MGRRGEVLAPRLRVTPSPRHPLTSSSVHPFPLWELCSVLRVRISGSARIGEGRWGDAERHSHRVSASPHLRVTPSPGHPLTGSCIHMLYATFDVGCSSLFLPLCSDLWGAVRTEEREMGRRGEVLAPRLRVTPSPRHPFTGSPRLRFKHSCASMPAH